MSLRAVRGATTVDIDTPEQITARVRALTVELLRRNALTPDDIVSVVVTATGDIRSAHPATAVRSCGLTEVPLLGARELDIIGGLERCIRMLVHVDTDLERTALRHVFLEGAVVLRPDLVARDG